MLNTLEVPYALYFSKGPVSFLQMLVTLEPWLSEMKMNLYNWPKTVNSKIITNSFELGIAGASLSQRLPTTPQQNWSGLRKSRFSPWLAQSEITKPIKSVWLQSPTSENTNTQKKTKWWLWLHRDFLACFLMLKLHKLRRNIMRLAWHNRRLRSWYNLRQKFKEKAEKW